MPWWKYFGNRFLTGLENLVFGLKLSEYHTGYRAYRREALRHFASLPPAPLEEAEGLEQLRALHHGMRIRVVAMDGDLQDRPEAIPVLLARHREGFDVVYAQRTGRKAGFDLYPLSDCFAA